MKEQNYFIKIGAIISIIMLIIIVIFNFLILKESYDLFQFIFNILMSVFTGLIATIMLSIVTYMYNRNNEFKDYYLNTSNIYKTSNDLLYNCNELQRHLYHPDSYKYINIYEKLILENYNYLVSFQLNIERLYLGFNFNKSFLNIIENDCKQLNVYIYNLKKSVDDIQSIFNKLNIIDKQIALQINLSGDEAIFENKREQILLYIKQYSQEISNISLQLKTLSFELLKRFKNINKKYNIIDVYSTNQTNTHNVKKYHFIVNLDIMNIYTKINGISEIIKIENWILGNHKFQLENKLVEIMRVINEMELILEFNDPLIVNLKTIEKIIRKVNNNYNRFVSKIPYEFIVNYFKEKEISIDKNLRICEHQSKEQILNELLIIDEIKNIDKLTNELIYYIEKEDILRKLEKLNNNLNM